MKKQKKMTTLKEKMDESIGFMDAQEFILENEDLWEPYIEWKFEKIDKDYSKKIDRLLSLSSEIAKKRK